MQEKFIKISSATYKALDYLPESDPIKNKSKEKVLAILENLSFIFDTQGWASIKKDNSINQLKLDIDIFLSYLEIAKNQKWLDQINYLIISKQYKDLAKDLPEQAVVNKEPDNNKQDHNSQDIITEKLVETKESDLTERQKKIIEILQEKEKAQVSDIIKFMPDITKRTIRRDIDGLLEAGKIVRVGEWNKIFYQVLKKNNNRTVLLS